METLVDSDLFNINVCLDDNILRHRNHFDLLHIRFILLCLVTFGFYFICGFVNIPGQCIVVFCLFIEFKHSVLLRIKTHSVARILGTEHLSQI